MPRSGLTGPVTAVGVALLVLAAGYASALHRNVPVYLQVTQVPSTSVGNPEFAGRSNVLFFDADGDFLANGNSVSQIFAFDLKRRVKVGESAVFQLTDAALPSTNPTVTRRGKFLAFQSTADLLANGSTGRQLFAATKTNWKKSRVPLFQVTYGPGESFDPQFSANGKFVYFSSDADLTGEGVGAGTHLYRTEIRRLEKSECPTGYPCPAEANPGLALVTPEVASNPSPDRKGLRVVFQSTGDVAGTGCGVGITQIFLRDFRAGTVEQLTCGAADSRNPTFTLDGKRVLFESDADLLGTAAGHTQIYLLDLREEPPVLTQMTFGTDGDSTMPASHGTRRKVRFFFLSDANITGTTPAGTIRLHEFDELNGTAALSDGETVVPSLSAQFTFVAFASDGDLVGNGNTEPQLFVVNAYPVIEP